MGPIEDDDIQPLSEGTHIHIDAGDWGLTWAIRSDGQLAQIALGARGHLAEAEAPVDLYPLAYRTWGAADPYREAALRVTHADGMLTTRLRAAQVQRHRLEVGDEHIIVRCDDELLEFSVDHHFRTHRASGVLEQWIEIEHHESGPVTLHDYDSLCHFFLVEPTAEICQFGGAGWADEWHWTTERLDPGIRSLNSLGGVQPHLQRSPMLIVSPNGPSSETSGATIAMSIAWGGNTRFHLDVRPKGGPDSPAELVLKAGANPYGADYRLDRGQRFVTPTVAWTWQEGRAATTHAFHDWTRARVLRDPAKRRAIVANNWEATFFDFDQQRITELIETSADLGAEVFLLDDGWFGSEFPRDTDEQGLGDWQINSTKLPDGLQGLADDAERAGIRFGIWVEPEMVNPRSVLYRDHPEWVLRGAREPAEHRYQLYLDPLQAEVRDFESGVVDQTLRSATGISYLKWDANRPITDPGSASLPPDRQSNLYVDGVWRTWEVMSQVAEKHPEVEMMLCASGGGRSDHGTLRYFHEFWTSDNTDALTRIGMQWAALHFFPASVVAAHVTRWGERPLGFACAVALSARFGIDLDLTALSAAEIETLRTAVAVARRTQDLVQRGRLVRLVSPVEGPDRSRAALAFVGAHRPTRTSPPNEPQDAVVFRYQILEGADAALSPTTIEGDTSRQLGIDPEGSYRVRRTEFGADAANHGEQTIDGEHLLNLFGRWTLSRPLTAEIWEITPSDLA